MAPPEAGLRERSKSRRKLAITDAALNLFAQRGSDATTVTDIAAAAEIAPRTVAHYFASKQDIALGPFSEAADRLVMALDERPSGVTTLAVIERWLTTEAEQPDPWDADLCGRMFAANPELAALRTARMAPALSRVRVAFATDLGIEPAGAEIQVITSATAGAVVELASMAAGQARTEAVALTLQFLRAGIGSLRT